MRFARTIPALLGVAGCVALPTASLQAQADPGAAPATKFQRFVSHFDFAASAVGEFDSSVTGKVQNSISPLSGQQLSINPTKTVGVMGTIRGQKSPWIGGEFNYRWARYSQVFNYASRSDLDFNTRNTANEFTLGYIARPDHPLAGFKPFLGAGAGTVEFKPSRGSGAGLPVQARAAYYYTVGGDHPVLGENFGVRLGFRQVFYLAPDFGQNFLTIKKRAISTEPTIGFYLHF